MFFRKEKKGETNPNPTYQQERKTWLPALGLLLIPLSFILYQKLYSEPKEERENAFHALTDTVVKHLRAEENAVPLLPAFSIAPETTDDLATQLIKNGARAFQAKDYSTARESFSQLRGLFPEDQRFLILLAVSNLRESNFSLASEVFLAAKATPILDPTLSDSVDLGLSLALFYLMNLEEARPLARGAYTNRLHRLGPAHPETNSAANILAVILIGLGETQEAETILESTVKEAQLAGISASSPLIIDSLNILALSYGLSDSAKDVLALLESPYGLNADLELGEPVTDPYANPTGDLRQAPNEAPDLNLLNPASPGPANETSPANETNLDPTPPLDYPKILATYYELAEAYPRSPIIPQLLEALISYLNPKTPPAFYQKTPLENQTPRGQAYDPGGEILSQCSDPGPHYPEREKLFFLCFKLVSALDSQGLYSKSFPILDKLIAWEEIANFPQIFLLYREAAFKASASGDLAETEKYLRLSLESLFAKESLEPNLVSFILLRTISLADTVLAQGKSYLEAEIDLVFSLTFLKKKLPKNAIDTYPETSLYYWYLARVLREQSRQKDANSYFNQADKILNALLKKHPETEELKRIRELIKKDKNSRNPETRPSFPRSPLIFFGAENITNLKSSPTFVILPSPIVLRLELQALTHLHRTPDFLPRIQAVIAQAEATLGPGSPNHLRYLSLRLKYYEELGDYPNLLKDLEAMVALAPTEEIPRAHFLSSARSYEARILEATGDLQGAKNAYEKAYEHISPLQDSEARALEILNNLNSLNQRIATRDPKNLHH
ncbi:MAG: tetratricopeptide repeat protein [Deltaproteobacteria bacterium]|jgi:tetratricopeptide (TPR) repeat protein|nr:tetratricopeptide repeat protein [Deltaproteobacteria bacterium]